MTASFAARLSAATSEHGALCVGIDPHPYLLMQWGLADTPEGLLKFCEQIITAARGIVGVFKPQSAFFERHGSAGIAVLERVLRMIHEAGALSILDAKRGDLGSTMHGYAEAYLTPGAAGEADALTVTPYMGVGSLLPACMAAREHGKGLFVLALTSNPEGPQIQRARTAEGDFTAVLVAKQVAEWNKASRETNALEIAGSFGLVVGPQTDHADVISQMNLADMSGPILVPGFGAQGGTADDVAELFSDVRRQVLINSSRAIAEVGPHVSDIRAMIEKSRAQVAEVLS